MKSVKYGILMKEKPEFAVQKAVKGMLPDNTLGRAAIARLRVYAGAEHDQAAQKPIVREF
jgi:large subunit ribosomal protein L13